MIDYASDHKEILIMILDLCHKLGYTKNCTQRITKQVCCSLTHAVIPINKSISVVAKTGYPFIHLVTATLIPY